MARSSEENFQAIVSEIAKNIKNYEARVIKHYQYADTMDAIFANYGWNKQDFYNELNSRLGIETNETREKSITVKKTKKKSKG
jgi:hypothetical protein